MSPQARDDLIEIFSYISEESVDVASDFVADISAKIQWIVDVNYTGSPRDHIRKGLRGLPYRKRCIYYRSYSDRIVIVRVLHSAQDVKRQKFEER